MLNFLYACFCVFPYISNVSHLAELFTSESSDLYQAIHTYIQINFSGEEGHGCKTDGGAMDTWKFLLIKEFLKIVCF